MNQRQMVEQREERLRLGKAKEDKINTLLEQLDAEDQAILFVHLLTLGWRWEKAHMVKLRMGLTE
ncbi:MAG TPA: hypothetical protein VFS12_16965 [Terriglobia bacterium]|nr:hypothetical protein [Terriglobia bacterium]